MMHNRTLFCFACVLLSIIALSLLLSSTLVAQERRFATSEGTEFWITFQKNFRDSMEDYTRRERVPERDHDSMSEFESEFEPESLRMVPTEPLHQGLTISAEQAAEGYVEIPGTGFREEFSVVPGMPHKVWINSSIKVMSSEEVEDLGIHVVSNNPVSVVAMSYRYQTTDSYLAFPVSALGTRYRAMGYKWLASDLLSQLAVVATEDQTSVTILPSSRTLGGKPAGKPFTIELNRGQVYQVIPYFDPSKPSDLTGTLIESNKPVALFSGHNCAYVPINTYKACNLLIEQIPPVNSWGTSFVAAPFIDRKTYVLRVLADKEGTEIRRNGVPVASLGPGEFYEAIDLTENTLISSNLPVMVTQFATGFTYSSRATDHVADSIGDPMMIMLPPVNQFLSQYTVAVPFDRDWNNYVTIVLPKRVREALRMNNRPVDPTIFESIPNSDLMVGSFLLDGGAHRFDAPAPFGLIQYGFGHSAKIYDAYGNIGGMKFNLDGQASGTDKEETIGKQRQRAVVD